MYLLVIEEFCITSIQKCVKFREHGCGQEYYGFHKIIFGYKLTSKNECQEIDGMSEQLCDPVQ